MITLNFRTTVDVDRESIYGTLTELFVAELDKCDFFLASTWIEQGVRPAVDDNFLFVDKKLKKALRTMIQISS